MSADLTEKARKMLKNEQTRSEFSHRLRDCALSLSQGQSGNAPIRELQSHARELFFANSDSYLRTIGFLLDQWIKDYIFNFAGDVITLNSEAVDEIRERLLREDTATALLDLSGAICSAPENAFAAIERLITSYLEAIQEANQVVNELK
jgi:hypothetical protein